MNPPNKSYLQSVGVISMFILLLFACRPDPILPPGPDSIKVEAKVPTKIYSDVKTIFLDASETKTLNGRRELFFSWACTVFPAASGSPEIKANDRATAYVENLAPGEYKFQLTVKDNLGNINISSYELALLVDSIVGKTPVAIAGPDQQITSPEHLVVLDASETLAKNIFGRYLDFNWKVIMQPVGSAPVKLIDNQEIISKADYLVEGLYKFQFRIRNEYGVEAFDTLEVRVLPDLLKGTSKIFEDLKWRLEGDDDWGYYISLYIKEPDLFINRYPGNMDVRIWDEVKNDWSETLINWSTTSSGELNISINWSGDLVSYNRMDGAKTKVKVTLK